MIFVVVSGAFYTAVATSVPGFDPSDPASRAQVQPLNPPGPDASPELVAAAREASVDALHLAAIVCAALLRGRRGHERHRAAARAGRGGRRGGDAGRPPGRGGRLRRGGMTAPGAHGPRDWDGATYDRIADPMTRWGTSVLDRLPLRGDETVLDAGCGSGRVTERLLERLPDGRVVALDGSPAMIREARARLASAAGDG